MAFDGPQTTDYRNVISLNRAYLSLLQRDLRARHGLRQLSTRLSDKITGLSPVISIEQKSTSHNPRSTVGTITEIYDYLRLLYARAGTPC